MTMVIGGDTLRNYLKKK